MSSMRVPCRSKISMSWWRPLAERPSTVGRLPTDSAANAGITISGSARITSATRSNERRPLERRWVRRSNRRRRRNFCRYQNHARAFFRAAETQLTDWEGHMAKALEDKVIENVEPRPVAGDDIVLIPIDRRVRVMFGGAIVADSRHVMLMLEKK